MKEPKVVHRVITAAVDGPDKNGQYLGKIEVVTFMDNGDKFSEFAYCSRRQNTSDDAYFAAKHLQHRWAVPELIQGS